ncbi:hypothetical protein B0H67DRAFT_483686 [Lasiosphaeris hirsuta]|uniref:Beta-cyclopiazonate dehydrogenase n=1 Tax=Lasiosphaeris hirsuta TaxID=260670 RepID=A0AA40AS64_9PEZI|nr:hypothetical protein B0H67DRAFT_483686 [Lasiosphaeris hirsuta]
MASTARLVAGLLAGASLTAGAWLPESICTRIITRDVVIIGGGASGSYAAVRLKEDYNKSIVLVEKRGLLGGHVSTFDDPDTGTPFDFGVQSFNDYGPARAFFQRMNVTVGVAPRTPLVSRFVDFQTGLPVNFTSPSAADRTAALQNFLNATQAYEDYLLPGYWNFPAPDDIPADLLLPFGEFVKKHNIHAAVNQIFEVTGLGVGDMVNALTMYVLGAFGAPMIRAFLGLGSTFTPTSRRNLELYEAIQSRLGPDILYNSTIAQTNRTALGHTLWIKHTNDGTYTLIRARKLLLAIEPTAANTASLALDATEAAVLAAFSYQRVHAGIVNHPSLPANTSLVNTPAAAAPANYLALPAPPAFNARFDHMGGGSGNFRVLMVGNETFGVAEAQGLVRENVGALVAAGTIPAASAKVVFKAWADHGAMHMHVSAAEIRQGFIQKLYALQGRRATWWTGGAFSVQFQAVLWAFDDTLLPRIVA